MIKLTLILSLLLLSCSKNATPKMYPAQTNIKQLQFEKSGFSAQDAVPQVDILFIIDSSGSMSTFQENLTNNIQAFTDAITARSRLNYRIGVLQSSLDEYQQYITDPTCGDPTSSACDRSVNYLPSKLVRDPRISSIQGGTVEYDNQGGTPYIDSFSVNGKERLVQRLTVGTGGSGTEVFFDVISNFLEEDTALAENSPDRFTRKEAPLVIIFLTDASDQSDRIKTAEEIFSEVSRLKGSPDKILAFGALIPTEDQFGCADQRDQGEPVETEAFINKTGGTVLELCDPEFGTEIAKIGKDISDKLGTTMYLSQLPSLNTVKVVVGGRELTKEQWGYDPDKNALILYPSEDDVKNNNTIEVSYLPARFENETVTIGN